jgi:hypothetical protein
MDRRHFNTGGQMAPAMRLLHLRIRTLMIVVLVSGLWLGLGIAFVRLGKTQREREANALLMSLIPIGAWAHYHLQRWHDAIIVTDFPDPIPPNYGKCPDCGATIQMLFRTPVNWRQATQGGSTCKKCGCEVDWGDATCLTSYFPHISLANSPKFSSSIRILGVVDG